MQKSCLINRFLFIFLAPAILGIAVNLYHKPSHLFCINFVLYKVYGDCSTDWF